VIYLLDTNVVAEITTRPKPAPAVVAWARSVPAPALYLSVITIADIEAGIAAAPDPLSRGNLTEPTWRSACCSQRWACCRGRTRRGPGTVLVQLWTTRATNAAAAWLSVTPGASVVNVQAQSRTLYIQVRAPGGLPRSIRSLPAFRVRSRTAFRWW